MNKTTVSLLLVGAIGVAVGCSIGWFLGRRSVTPMRGYEVRTRTILTNPDGRPIGELAPGVLVVTSERLDPQSDLGWWGYVPVDFGTGTEAAQIIRTSPKHIASPVSATVRALLPGDVPPPTENRPQR